VLAVELVEQFVDPLGVAQTFTGEKDPDFKTSRQAQNDT
jgi:hypothetical protein